ncbi:MULTISPECIES: DUF3164 family protein [Kingella]|uniref:Sulfate transporter n=2 Tax=Kingella kingae TaxID=504 RepID=F5S4B9_KINKI|nr:MULTISPECIES: DUF3164 family protein [Kingella]EGK12357.1 hypothetical protein HMPREF0476_0052 [Kingella kingae ATCC 23330]MBD3614228.1 DUF3164 family protein [Kingella kingae]MBD3632826.1 DUF3164 family protein [Kingella kingae]MBD3658874.1 DUF3164 family protein [Kingella kingae]MDK4529707.1 DUF3164 family protein [Kingella kingae]
MNEIDLSQYRQDARGNLIPIENIKEIDLDRDELVKEIFAAIETPMRELEQARRNGIEDVRAFVELAAEKYGAKPSKKGNVTLHSFDGELRVTVAMADVLTFDERLTAAKTLIDECLDEWTQDSRQELKTIVQQAFDVNKEGNISTAKVLGLRRLNIEHEKWQRAMTAIDDSIHTQTTREYIRIHRRDENGAYVLVSPELGKA